MNSSDIAFYAGFAASLALLGGVAYILINKPDPVKQNADALQQLDRLYQEVINSKVLSPDDSFAAERYLFGLRSLFVAVFVNEPHHQLVTNLRFIIEENLPCVIGMYLSVDTAYCAPGYGDTFLQELEPFQRQLDQIVHEYESDLDKAAALAKQDINWANRIAFTF